MVRLLSTKKRFECPKIIHSHRSSNIVKCKERRHQILRQSIKKLKKMPDTECCLRQAVLIRNTYNCAKQMTNEQINLQLEKENSEKENIIKSICEDSDTKYDMDKFLKSVFDENTSENT